MQGATLVWEALDALRDLAQRRAELPAPAPPGAREWSHATEVADCLEVHRERAEAALDAAVVLGRVEEHRDWPGYFRLTESGRDGRRRD